MSSARFYSWSTGIITMSGGLIAGGSAKVQPRLTGPARLTLGGGAIINVTGAIANQVTFTSGFGLSPFVTNTVTFTSQFTNNTPGANSEDQLTFYSRFTATDGDVGSRRYRR